MRPHGRAKISAHYPQSLGICYRCGFLYNRDALKWQFDWRMGPRLYNTGTLVCETCYDQPQESGRPIVLPPDPIAVEYASPERYALANNPVSPVNFNPASRFLPLPAQSANIGNMTLNAGVDAVFDGVVSKRAQFSAALVVSNSSFNTVGKNWNAYPSGITVTMPSTVSSITHIVSSFTITAPTDQGFLNSANGVTNFYLQGSNNGATWITIYSGTTSGGVGEAITATTTSAAPYPYHRIAIVGDGISAVAIAQLALNVSDAFPNDF